MTRTDELQRITGALDKGDVLVTATYYEDSGNIVITCKQMPGAWRWEEPSADMMRDMADTIADRNGKIRSGRRHHIGGWSYLYRTA